MPLRHRHRVGHWLVTDENSGIVYYEDEVITRWDGVIVHRKDNETRQPQEFVAALGDPYAVEPVRPDALLPRPHAFAPAGVGVTGINAVRTGTGPGSKFYQIDGIGTAVIDGLEDPLVVG